MSNKKLAGIIVGCIIVVTSIVAPATLSSNPPEQVTDYMAVSAAFVVMALVGRKVGRIDGALLVGVYGGYMVYLFGFTAGV